MLTQDGADREIRNPDVVDSTEVGPAVESVRKVGVLQHPYPKGHL